MYLRKIAPFIYEEDTASENLHVTIFCKNRAENWILWEGRAKDLQDSFDCYGWIVVEIRRSESEITTEYGNILPRGNRSLIIEVE